MEQNAVENKLKLTGPEDLFSRLDNEDFQHLSQSVVTTTLDKLVNWGRENSIGR